MIACLIGADWGEQGARGGKKDRKGRQFVDAQKDRGVEGWGGAIRNESLYNPICSVRSSSKKQKGFCEIKPGFKWRFT